MAVRGSLVTAFVGALTISFCLPGLSPAQTPPQAPVRIGGDMQGPKKIKDVKPVYPEEARAAGIQGTVIVEAKVGTDGSVLDAKVLRSVESSLDLAALDAVRQWKFMPTLLNGAPVEVIMTASVRFALGESKAGETPLRVGGDIKEPKKIKDVRPFYPEDARNEKIQGTVILECIIATDGTVRQAKILRSAHPSLDVAASEAVMQWEYTPTLLNGAPVELLMTVTVSFTLNQDNR